MNKFTQAMIQKTQRFLLERSDSKENNRQECTFAQAFANPSKVTYFSPEMLNISLLAFSLPSTLRKAVAKS